MAGLPGVFAQTAPAAPPGGSFAERPRLYPAPAAGDVRERADVLAQGEAALSRRRPLEALDLFERATNLRHEADAEAASARALVQTGDYAAALTRAAHAAGAHREAPAAAALYAWLLRAGGQTAAADRVVADALALHPEDRVLHDVRQALGSGQSEPTENMLSKPYRMAPPAVADQGFAVAPSRPVSGAVLVDGGHRAVAPRSAMPAGPVRVWVRNGLGDTREAALEDGVPSADAPPGARIVVLRLAAPLAAPATASAPRAPFAGSIAYAARHAGTASQAAWPWLQGGFLGSSRAGGERSLGIEIPAGTEGGPVFDAAGRVIGISAPAEGGATFVAAEAWRGAFADRGAPVTTAGGMRAVTEIYSAALLLTLQVFAEPIAAR